MRNHLLFFALLLGCALADNFASQFRTLIDNVEKRDVDGGDGEFTRVCALKGYYEFFADSTTLDPSSTGTCMSGGVPQPSSAQLVAHFYTQSGNCLADFIFTSYVENECVVGATGSPLNGGVQQHFEYGITSTFALNIISLSQSNPVAIFESDCCFQSGTMLVGQPVEDINVRGLKGCPTMATTLPYPCV